VLEAPSCHVPIIAGRTAAALTSTGEISRD
jgi:hypothetical protein